MKGFYGWKPDNPALDSQDKKFKLPFFGMASRYMPESMLPQDVDLFNSFPPVMYQGPANTCTVHAVTTAMRYNFIDNGFSDVELSRLQAYYDAGVFEGDTKDDGRQIRDVIRVAVVQGIIREQEWPYDLTQIQTPAPPPVHSYKITDAFSVEVTTRAIRTALYLGHPIVIGIKIFKSFESDQVAANGMVPMPGRFETEIGGHAIVIGRNNQAWPLANKCRNSWGPQWGDHGDFFLSDEYVLKFGSDAWSVLTNTGA